MAKMCVTHNLLRGHYTYYIVQRMFGISIVCTGIRTLAKQNEGRWCCKKNGEMVI